MGIAASATNNPSRPDGPNRRLWTSATDVWIAVGNLPRGWGPLVVHVVHGRQEISLSGTRARDMGEVEQ